MMDQRIYNLLPMFHQRKTNILATLHFDVVPTVKFNIGPTKQVLFIWLYVRPTYGCCLGNDQSVYPPVHYLYWAYIIPSLPNVDYTMVKYLNKWTFVVNPWWSISNYNTEEYICWLLISICCDFCLIGFAQICQSIPFSLMPRQILPK